MSCSGSLGFLFDCTLGFNGEGPSSEERKRKGDDRIQVDSSKEKYEVEKIMGYSQQNGRNFYQYCHIVVGTQLMSYRCRVKWKGYAQPTWEPDEHLEVIQYCNRSLNCACVCVCVFVGMWNCTEGIS